MGWREDVDAVTNGTPHGPLITGISGDAFPCACGMKFPAGWMIYRHGHGETKPMTISGLQVVTDPTMPPDTVTII